MILYMAENLAKFNNAMSQFQSGQDGINNYLQKQGGELAGRASSAISSSIGISQEDKEAMDEAVGMLAGAAPIALAVGKKLATRAGARLGLTKGAGSVAKQISTKLAGKGAETAKAGESAKGESSEGVGEESANAGMPEEGTEMGNMAGAQSVKAAEFPEEVLDDTPLGSTPSEGPGTSTSAGKGAEGSNPGEEAAEGGEDAAEGGEVAGEGGEVAAGAGEAAAGAGETAAAVGVGETAAATGLETAAAFVPVVGEVLVAAAAVTGIVEGIKDLFGGGSHASAVKAAFTGDIASSGATTAFTTGSYAVASADGVTTQTGGSSAF